MEGSSEGATPLAPIFSSALLPPRRGGNVTQNKTCEYCKFKNEEVDPDHQIQDGQFIVPMVHEKSYASFPGWGTRLVWDAWHIAFGGWDTMNVEPKFLCWGCWTELMSDLNVLVGSIQYLQENTADEWIHALAPEIRTATKGKQELVLRELPQD